jgi:hypothetical protein
VLPPIPISSCELTSACAFGAADSSASSTEATASTTFAVVEDDQQPAVADLTRQRR